MSEPHRERQVDADGQAKGLERLVLFSDAVFAIAITLLALDIRLPAGSEGLSPTALRDQLLALAPNYLSYVLSFLVIGQFWWGHHAKFRLIRRFDDGLFWLNLLLLMVIAFVPFPTSVLSENGNSTATILYALTMAVAGLLNGLISVYAVRGKRLVNRSLSREDAWRGPLTSLVIASVFLVSVPIALFDAQLAKYSWILLAPLQIAVGRVMFASPKAAARTGGD